MIPKFVSKLFLRVLYFFERRMSVAELPPGEKWVRLIEAPSQRGLEKQINHWISRGYKFGKSEVHQRDEFFQNCEGVVFWKTLDQPGFLHPSDQAVWVKKVYEGERLRLGGSRYNTTRRVN